jgi:hypothetical protein
VTADGDHKWGLAPYHFQPAYNQHVRAHLLAERQRLSL